MDEGGEGEYVNLYSSTQANGENTHRTVSMRGIVLSCVCVCLECNYTLV